MSKERDWETGYDYMEQRYYWKDGSFWSRPDPLMDKDIELSPYAYCDGNPLIRIDPDGRADYYDIDGIGLTGNQSALNTFVNLMRPLYGSYGNIPLNVNVKNNPNYHHFYNTASNIF